MIFLYFILFNNKSKNISKKGPNTCSCNSGFTGTNCNIFTCITVGNCSSHGVCIGKKKFFYLNEPISLLFNLKKILSLFWKQEPMFVIVLQDMLEQVATQMIAHWWTIVTVQTEEEVVLVHKNFLLKYLQGE